MKLNPESIARASSRHPWSTVGLWIVAIAVAGLLASNLLADALTTDVNFTDRPESVQAQSLLEEVRGEEQFSEFVIVQSESVTATDPAFQAFVGELVTAVRGLGADKVSAVGSYLEMSGPVSADGRTALIVVTLAHTDPDRAKDDAADLESLVHGTTPPVGFETLLAGRMSLENVYQELAEDTLAKGEAFGIVIALIVLTVVIGTVVAAVLPILLAIAAIGVAMGLTAAVGVVFDMSFMVTNFITMMGLAVGIDYSLFIVARYREERVRGAEKLEAIGRAGATANRAVFFSGLTVVLALLGLFWMPNTIFRSLSTGAVLVVSMAMAASMTLLPAVLALLGDKVNRLRVRRQHSLDNVDKVGGFWDRISNAVMRRPVLWLVGGAGLLLLIASAFFGIKTGFAGVSTLPDTVEAKQAFLVLEEEFSAGLGEPVYIVVDGTVTPEIEAGMTDLVATLAADSAFGPPMGGLQEVGGIVFLSVPLQGDPSSRVSTDAVTRLRAEYVPASFPGIDTPILVGGMTAFVVDFFEDVDTYTPIVFVFVLGLSFLLLTVVFRSVVLPIKAILLNLLSVGAAYGMVVLFFQPSASPGWIQSIAEWLGFIQSESIEIWLPLFLFAILFGLSMDYHVFLLTRIREYYDRSGDNREAVAHGLRTTGAIITGAALIMVAVFGGFAAGDLVMMQQMGFGLAVAVLLDATIIRSILVPASMRLLGEWNWYLPKWLQWLPELDIEGHAAAAVAHEREVHA
jgi:putative drug exporter of the RND superfamily